MIKEFQGEYRWLSNFWPVNIDYKGRVYPNLENAFHSAKNESTVWKDYCTREDNPKIVKKYCHQGLELRSDWEEIKEEIMRELVSLKFSQEPFKTKLLETGDQEIQEGNTWGDVFWGVDLKTGLGENRFGKIIMDVREELKNIHDGRRDLS